jgi:hypothetical protein
VSVQVEEGIAVACHPGGIGLAVKHAEGASVTSGGFDAELARGESEQIGGKRLRFGEVE